MPCESIVLNQVHLGLANKELLAAALKELGATRIESDMREGSTRFMYRGGAYAIMPDGNLVGRMVAETVGAVADRIKQAYSAQAIQKAAKRFGWTTKKTAGNKFAIKRG